MASVNRVILIGSLGSQDEPSAGSYLAYAKAVLSGSRTMLKDPHDKFSEVTNELVRARVHAITLGKQSTREVTHSISTVAGRSLIGCEFRASRGGYFSSQRPNARNSP